MSEYLSRINQPHDVKKLTLDELAILGSEIREKIMDVVDRNGGHLASNLGTVELTLALHRVFDLPRDRLVWDTSHQTYPHKLITGRRDRFDKLRQYNGICGFCNHRESIYDLFDAGHAGTAASLALGTAAGDQVQGNESKSIAVVGDAAIAAGMAFEALNHGGELKPNLLVILNDNNMSIDHAVGALSQYLTKVRAKPLYQDLKKEIHESLSKIPVIGKHLDSTLERIEGVVKHTLVPGLLFQELGFDYFGPSNGHDLPGLVNILQDIKSIRKPVLLHLSTVKGYGYEAASNDPVKYHALKNFKTPPARKPASAEPLKPKAVSWSGLFTELMHDLARKDSRVVAVTAAMPGGTGLMKFKTEFPDRYFDVGIAEQHGCAFSTGLAYSGLRPVFAVYSTFCQRAYDQFIHDVCIQEKSVIFCLDRAGLAGEDGWTHHGAFDVSYMRCIPNAILMAPAHRQDFERMMRLAVDETTRPVAIRYPKATVPTDLPESSEPELVLGKAQVMLQGEDVALFAYGAMVENAFRAALSLRERGINATVVNARFAKPLDVELLRELASDHDILLTVEENALNGGFGSAIMEACGDEGIAFKRIARLGIPDQFITFGSRSQLLKDCGLDPASIEEKVENLVDAHAKEASRFFQSDFVPARTVKRPSLS